LPFWLEIAYSRPFLGVFGAYFFEIWPPMETRHLTHRAWKSVQRFDLGVGSRKKIRRSGQSKKADTVPIDSKICMAGNLADVITCAKFQDIFRDHSFTGVEFPIFLLIFAWALQHCSANAVTLLWRFAIFARAVFVVFHHKDWVLLRNVNSSKLFTTLFHYFWLFWPLAIIAVFRSFAIWYC